MIEAVTALDLFAYNDWARDGLAAALDPLSDAQLDRPFEMGCGTLRETLRHLYGAERIWYERWSGPEFAEFGAAGTLHSVCEIVSAWRGLTARRATWIGVMQRGDFDRMVNYATRDGTKYTHRLGDLMLHVCNHGAHHRAQAANMLRHLGQKPPWLDYLARTIAQPDSVAEMNPETLRRFFAYGDWANQRVLAEMDKLPESAWDRPFEMGLGSLRRTMIHVADGESWWLANWREESGAHFPAADRTLPGTVRQHIESVAGLRTAYLASLTQRDLMRAIRVVPRPGVTRVFPLGVTMAQLCFHGTYHRAQALNMLRHLGGTAPGLDYVLQLRELA